MCCRRYWTKGWIRHVFVSDHYQTGLRTVASDHGRTYSFIAEQDIPLPTALLYVCVCTFTDAGKITKKTSHWGK